MSKPVLTRYRTLNWSSYNASLRERGSLTVWLDLSMPWHAAPSGKRGGQAVYSDAAIQACLTIKVLFGLPLRQTTGFVASLLKLAGLDWPVPDFSTLCRRQKTLAVQLPCRGSSGPLHLLVDSTAIKVRGEGEWHARKHGGSRGRVWRKVHLAVNESTLEVRAVEITGSGVGDAPVLPDLLAQIPEGEPIASVTADGAYDTRGCRDAIANRGADAVIPPRRNAKPWKKDSPGAEGRNEALRAIKRLGRTIWHRWSGYHRRSRVETKMNCMKLLGQKLMARDFNRQTAELQVRIAILNRFTALGIPVTEPVA
ncbi:IS5 family transposase [Paracoccus sp. YIM 132242]|uniref:IS5 family transposase n=1 Tax=Paracoccus lichenicola TaxID=2665644 RepID=A0A6L6HPL9_9RHOB|nr:IS5 family transposase [Paracoccus lichenicola]MTE01114.1 IS5 family transposase [Paracoccus lichenicola]